MMKTGILTLPLHTNYGGILQAYALQTVLERMGHDAYVISLADKPLRLPVWRMPVKYARRLLRNLKGHPYPIFYERKFNREKPIVRQHTDKFIRRYIKPAVYEGYGSIREGDFDAIVVGSDQVWRPQYFDDIRTAYLDFTSGWKIRRMAYAASFGTDRWEYGRLLTAQCARLLKRFDYVSVREDSGVDLCRERFGVEAEHVLDPTMLLHADDYALLAGSCGMYDGKRGMMCYILDDTPWKAALTASVAESLNLQPFRVNSRVEDINAPLAERVQPPVEQWLRGFIDSRFVITDSFHACVFSIIFNKPFIAVANRGRGVSRFRSLLSMFGLEARLLDEEASPDVRALVSGGIQWDDVNGRLSRYRDMSMDFLARFSR